MKIKFSVFTVKDIVFLAIVSAALSIVGALTMPLVMTLTLFGIRNLAAAVFYGAFCTIALMKVRKPGALVIIGLLTGIVVLPMAAVMFFNNLMGALAAELAAMIIFRGYDRDRAVVCAAALFIPFTMPVTFVFSMLLHGRAASEVITNPVLSAIICAGAVAVSFGSAFVGHRIGKELKKAGKLI